MPIAPNSLAARDIAYNIHPYTNLRVHEQQDPLVITEGRSVFVKDDDGKEYIEGLAGLWCTSLGFSNKRLVEAARRQMEPCPTCTSSHRSTEPVIELAEAHGHRPKPLQKSLFVNSGRGDRHRDQADLVLQQCAGQAGEEADHRPAPHLSRHHPAAGHLTRLPYARAGFDLPMSDRFFVTPPSHHRGEPCPASPGGVHRPAGAGGRD